MQYNNPSGQLSVRTARNFCSFVAKFLGRWGKLSDWRVNRGARREFIFEESTQKKYSTPTKQGAKFVIPTADEFRESARRQEQHARSEDLSGELQGELEGRQPTELKR